MKRGLIISLLIGSITAFFVYLLYFVFEKQNLLYLSKFDLLIVLSGTLVFSALISLLVNYLMIFRYLDKMNEKLNDWPNENDVKSNTGKVLTDLERNIDNFYNGRAAEIHKLQKLETHRKEYIGNVSHELKTPIFNIQGYLETLIDGGLHDEEVNMKFLEKASQSAQRMNQIVDDLQIISQFESDEMVLEKEDFDIIALCKDIADAMDLMANQKDVSILLITSSNQKLIVHADKFRIRRVLTNLIVNAINYNKINGEVRLKFYELDDKIKIEVSDNGIGIPESHLSRLFERFYRVDKHRSRENGGSGLGLSIVKHIIEAHHQSIEVMSTQNVGSVFSFTLSKKP